MTSAGEMNREIAEDRRTRSSSSRCPRPTRDLAELLGNPTSTGQVIKSSKGTMTITVHEDGWALVGRHAGRWDGDGPHNVFEGVILRCHAEHNSKSCLGHQDNVVRLAKAILRTYR